MAGYKKSIFIFTRDLRVTDNLALIEACKNSTKVIPIFIFTPTQTKNNTRFSSNAFQFMVESLKALEKDIPLQYFYGENKDVVKKILNNDDDIEAIYISQDYTPFAKKRENELSRLGVDLYAISNHTLVNIDTLETGGGKKYSIYSHFRNKFKKTVKVPKPEKGGCKNFTTAKGSGSISLSNVSKYYTVNRNIHVNGGRKNGQKILSGLKKYKKYSKTRNLPKCETTNLSAHNKFGTVSIREVWYAIKKAGIKDLLDQLIWREFYYYILHNNKGVLSGDYNEKWSKFKWKSSGPYFSKWCEGNTGFPIIDAGMRQMNQTGYMHNRVRMLVAMFLTKNLMIDWRRGEKYFSQMLVDYDPAQNNGNWQWNAGTGVDPLRYGKPRIMNPWSQQKNYDPDCVYIKRWVPELERVPVADIHKWDSKFEKYDVYLEPIVDYSETVNEFIKEFNRSVKQR